MTNNDVLRRVRYMFRLSDAKVIELFKHADYDVTTQTVGLWQKKDDDAEVNEMQDRELALFFNGLIIENRGRREGPQPEPEDPLTNNMIIRKLKIALNLKTTDILDLYASIDKPISKSELSDFMRNEGHKLYRPCGEQYLRNFLNALQAKYDKAKG